MSLAVESRAGETLNGAYSLDMRVRSEGFYEAYLATDRYSGQPVTVKVLRPEVALNPAVADRFLTAPRLFSGLSHPNLPQVLDIDLDETGIPFFVEEHVEGEALSNEFQKWSRGLPVGLALDLFLQVVRAVAEGHERGLVHGRLNPREIVLVKEDSRTVVKVLDFCGAASEGEGGKSGGDYLPPEARERGSSPDPTWDVWSIGALMFEGFAGATVAEAEADETGRRKSGRTTSLVEAAPNLPRSLCDLVDSCLADLPEERPRDARAIERWMTNEPPEREAVGFGEAKDEAAGENALEAARRGKRDGLYYTFDQAVEMEEQERAAGASERPARRDERAAAPKPGGGLLERIPESKPPRPRPRSERPAVGGAGGAARRPERMRTITMDNLPAAFGGDEDEKQRKPALDGTLRGIELPGEVVEATKEGEAGESLKSKMPPRRQRDVSLPPPAVMERVRKSMKPKK